MIACEQEALCNFIHSRRAVSFVELTTNVADSRGPYELSFFDGTLVVWAGLSDVLIRVLMEDLIKTKRIVIHPCSVLIYLCDGAVPQLPLAKAFRHYQKPHWVPSILDTIEHVSPRMRKQILGVQR